MKKSNAWHEITAIPEWMRKLDLSIRWIVWTCRSFRTLDWILSVHHHSHRNEAWNIIMIINVLICLPALPRAMTVVGVRGIPSIGTLSTAVITNSRAEAKAFSMELSFLRNKLVTIPRTALFRISINTSGWVSVEREEAENAVISSP